MGIGCQHMKPASQKMGSVDQRVGLVEALAKQTVGTVVGIANCKAEQLVPERWSAEC